MMKNEYFLQKALALIPELYKTEVPVQRTVTMHKEPDGSVRISEAELYRQQRLKKGSKVCLDFGNHQVGYLTLKLAGAGSHADAPVWLKLHFAENPAELFETAEHYQGWICSSWIEEEQIHVDIIPSAVKLPRRYAFRYVELEVLDISSKFDLIVEEAVCTAVSSVREEELSVYQTEDPFHAELDRIACRTLHECMQLVFEDGPKRDRRLWIGDLRIQALVNYETYQKNDLVKECLYLFAALPLENGQVSACLFLEPEPEADDTVMFDYSLFFVPILLDYYRATEDMETLRELWPTALCQIYLAEGALGEDDVIRDSDQMGWCFLDWNLELNKQAGAQGVFLYALKSAVEIAGLLGEEKEKKRLLELYEGCRNAANRVLWDEEAACYLSGRDRQISYASQVWMILGGAIDGEEAVQLLERVENDPSALKMVTPYMYHHYIDALLKAGEKEKALRKLEEYWGGMARIGADTFWELYNPENPGESPYGGTIVNSYCHAWSCSPAYFLRKYFRE